MPVSKRRRVCQTPDSYLDALNHKVACEHLDAHLGAAFIPQQPAAQQAAAQQPAAQQYLHQLNQRMQESYRCALPTEVSACGEVIRADSEFELPTPSRQVRRQRPRRDKAQTPLKLRGQRVSRRASRAASGAPASVQAAMSELCLRRARWFKVGPGRSLTVAVVVELFAGTGRFTRAMQQHMPTLKWDILMGDSYDLLKRENQYLIFGWIKAGRVAAVWMGTPCDSMTKARNRPGGPPALRNAKHPHGLPNLRPADQAAVRVGNVLGRFSAHVLLLCCFLLIPAVIENPATSWLWSTKWMVSLQRRRNVGLATTEFCQWQSLPFRKSTSLLHTHIDLSAVSARRCLGAKRGLCLATGCPHHVLKGKDSESGKFWTKVAEPYPRRWCHQLALAADVAISLRLSERHWQRVDLMRRGLMDF
jgi:hypothetical protein